MKDNYNNPNRPRVVWQGNKCVIKKPEVQKKAEQNNAPSRPANVQKKSSRVATIERPVKKRVLTANKAQTSGVGADFIAGLKTKSSFLTAILAIAAVSVIVAIAVTTLIPRNVEEKEDTEVTTGTQALTEVIETDVQPIVVPQDVTITASGEHIVCIDPGHGYDDVGTSNEVLGVYEHDVVLAVGLKLRDKLEAAGVKVYMTHDTNENPIDAQKPYLFGMTKRNGFANTISGIDLFISIHVDAYFDDNRVRGPRVYHMDTDTAGGSVAENLALELDVLAGDTEVQVKPMHGMNSYQVLRDSNMPAVLIETGFLSNEDEAKAMLTDEWRETTAQAIADAIIKSFEDNVI